MVWIGLYLNSYIRWRSIDELKSNSGMLSPCGVGMSQSKIVLSAKTVSTKPVSSARPAKSQTMSPALLAGEHATMPTTLTVSVVGPPRRKILVLYARRRGTLSKLQNSDCWSHSSFIICLSNQSNDNYVIGFTKLCCFEPNSSHHFFNF